MRHVILLLTLAALMFGCAHQEEQVAPPPPSVSDWTQLSTSEWRSTLTIHGRVWNLHAIRREDTLYLRQWIQCPEGATVPTEEMLSQAKNVLPMVVRLCDGTYGMALVGWFLSKEFHSTLPPQVLDWYLKSPEPEVRIITPVRPKGKES